MTGKSVTLTGIVTDVKWKPEQESIGHQFCAEEGKRILDHTLQGEEAHDICAGMCTQCHSQWLMVINIS